MEKIAGPTLPAAPGLDAFAQNLRMRALSIFRSACSGPAPASQWPDFTGLTISLSSVAAGLALSWERWGNPIVDSGRELNVPLRLLHGEMLYRDVGYLYGPLSPYLNAALYQIMNPSLGLVWARGIVTSIVILALLYWITRQIANPFVATLATLAITWICVLKPQGTYVMPYAFAGLDGCLFVLATLAAAMLWIGNPHKIRWLFLSGILAAFAILAKTEMGLAAIVTGCVACLLSGLPVPSRILRSLAFFLALALGLPALVFWRIGLRVGWHTLVVDNHLFFGHIPPALLFFNGYRFGFAHPLHSVSLMIVSFVQMVALGTFLVSLGLLLDAKRRERRTRLITLLTGSMTAIALSTVYLGDLGPFLSMPFFLILLILGGGLAFWEAMRQRQKRLQMEAAELTLLACSALASLARMPLRVSTGGALSSFLLPPSIILFVYLWICVLPGFTETENARRNVKRLSSGALGIAVIAAAITVSVRYQKKFLWPVVTARGTWRTSPEIGVALSEAYAFIVKKTAPQDSVSVIPEGTSLLFLADRRNPLHDEIVTPGFLDTAGEERAIADLQSTHTPLVLLANRPTPEFGAPAFGRDYDIALFSWIEQNYSRCAYFPSSSGSDPAIGSPHFFIRAYCLRTASAATQQTQQTQQSAALRPAR